jgi:aspartyl-tRNA(Asn)/glutamyl-tRNA(Gln) amidotransferase subunit C
MKNTDHIDVKYVAELARLELSDAEAEVFQGQLDDVLGYMEKLSEVDVEGVEPMAHPVVIQNVFREDVVRASIDSEKVLANAPARSGELIAVPTIIE